MKDSRPLPGLLGIKDEIFDVMIAIVRDAAVPACDRVAAARVIIDMVKA